MSDEAKKAKLELVQPPEDALDIAALWLDPALGDGLVNVHYHNIPANKPRDFFRVNPDPAYRRLTEIYTHKVEGQIEERIDELVRLAFGEHGVIRDRDHPIVRDLFGMASKRQAD